MRRILVEQARRKGSREAGGESGGSSRQLEEPRLALSPQLDDLLALDEALVQAGKHGPARQQNW